MKKKVSFCDDRSDTEDLLPVEDLIVIEGKLNGQSVRILKEDGCNTNVVSKEFYEAHKELFDVSNASILVSHSRKDVPELSFGVILNGRIECGAHKYVSNFAIANCRYDVLLGMPWHVQCEPKVNYRYPQVAVADELLPLERGNNSDVVNTNLGVKKFRSMLRNKGHRKDFEVFRLVETETLLVNPRCKILDGEMTTTTN